MIPESYGRLAQGAVHVLCQLPERVQQMLTIAEEGGGGLKESLRYLTFWIKNVLTTNRVAQVVASWQAAGEDRQNL